MHQLAGHGRGQSCSEANQDMEDNHGQERWLFCEQAKVQKKSSLKRKKLSELYHDGTM